jgi:hypothetical protein
MKFKCDPVNLLTAIPFEIMQYRLKLVFVKKIVFFLHNTCFT